MQQAAVGFQCPSCVAEGSKSQRAVRTTFGGKRSDNPALTSQVLIGLNAAVWLLISATGGNGSRWVERLALLPNSTPTQNGLAVGVADGAYWQLITSMFTHISLLHIGFNMLAVWIFGPQLEMLLGRARYLALYVLSGLVGSAFVYWFSAPYIPAEGQFGSFTIGASGAVFGLFAAYLLIAIKMRTNVTQLLVLLGINAFITFRPGSGISWQGHLGGFLGGLALGALFVYAPRGKRPLLHGAGIGALAVLLVVAVLARTVSIT